MRNLILAITMPVFLSAAVFAADPDEYRLEIEKIDAALLEQKWKPANKRARRLAATVVRHSWYAKDLEAILSELAFQQAAALVNLGDRDGALWYWAVAQNLDYRIVRKDLAAYGEAAKLFREFPLRTTGKIPAGFRVYPHDGNGRPPRLPKIPSPKILTNTGATIDRPGDFAVELVIDEHGAMHHPVVISTHLHPIVIYFVLEVMHELKPFEPARYDGEPVDCLYDLTIRFQVMRF